jgi:hypothetical protein
MASTPEDLTTPPDRGGEGVRVDAPAAPAATPVASGPTAPVPPRRTRKPDPPSVAASVPVEAVAEPVEAVAEPTLAGDDEDGVGPRRVRRTRARAAAPAPRPTLAPRTERRYRQTVVKVDLWSVTKLSLCFYLSAMFVTIVALVALWIIADAAGIVRSVEKFFGDLLSAKDFTFLSGEVLRGTILISLVIVALQVVVTVIAASFYNIFSELFGGLEITVKEEDASPR